MENKRAVGSRYEEETAAFLQKNGYRILEKNFRNMPDTLILTAEFDPLRDEGEAFGEKLKEAGNRVEVHRIAGAFHGYFALGIKFLHVQESFAYVNRFLETEEQEEGKHHEERICTVEKT